MLHTITFLTYKINNLDMQDPADKHTEAITC